MVDVEFRVLDGVEVRAGDRRLPLGHARQRCVLVALLVDANRAVTADRLLERVWDEEPPLRARSVLRTYVSRLRTALADTGATITRRDGGYSLDVEPDAVDLHRFRSLVARARQADDDERALDLVRRALRLWGTEVFAGLDTPWIDAVRRTLTLERAAADAYRIDLALRCGRHVEVLADLTLLVEDDPLDERLCGQLVVALHRAGRSADALRSYQRTREALIDRLGTEPGPELRRLHREVLVADSPDDRAVPAARRVPRHLPPSPRSFVGRSRELASLDALMTSTGDHPPIAVLAGGGGMGKTWLALSWAHGHRDRFPDGQLHVDLRGFDPVAEPLAPDAVTRLFLDALGVAPRDVPAEPDAQVALYRDLTADRRVLVVLDNARDTAQVTPLLPGGTSAAVLVTSRHRLTGLAVAHGAVTLAVGVLDERQAAEVLSRHLGAARVAAEPEATATLLRHCAGMPLALGILAARADAYPNAPLAALAEEVRDASATLDALETGDRSTSLRAVFSASVRVLDAGTTTLFALLGLTPGPDITATGAAALADVPVQRARQALRELEEANLVHQHVAGRYRMHDLVRLHAGELAGGDGGAALERLFDHYCYVASVAADRFTPGEPHRRPPVPAPSGPEVVFDSLWDGIAWLNAELATLMAVAEHGSPRRTTHLSGALARFLDATSHFHDALALHTAAVAVDGRDGYALARRGLALFRLGHVVEARDHYERALARAEEVGDLSLENIASTNLGVLCSEEEAGYADAVRHHERALTAARKGGYRHSEGIALVNLGELWCGLGRLDDARADLEGAALIARQQRDSGLGAVALSGLGVLHQRLGDREAARDFHRRAAELAGGGVLNTINVEVLNDLAVTVHQADGPEAALVHYQEALDLALRTDYRIEQARAHDGMAEALRDLGRVEESGSHVQRARFLRDRLDGSAATGPPG
ncbi:BTAD domain-containing putative transcriptional regulator [Umezawaea endophytica]|uniref:Tetratricopeptide repeat protein n=1 Tax=Umezawaea endophytica TaxID=1654476 RepID=A0A9X3ACS0_9PSEU|nr:BTAD domain-containing putative transcriptional regulator [Umezawaea endophytica]MCS7475367.1 tetratricopeptide repeat protein [Umezawaea endophytica]